MVVFFLARGAPVDAHGDSEEPRSSLEIACDHADIQLTDLLLRYDLVDGRTILHAAARFESYDIVDKLHKSQRDCNIEGGEKQFWTLADAFRRFRGRS